MPTRSCPRPDLRTRSRRRAAATGAVLAAVAVVLAACSSSPSASTTTTQKSTTTTAASVTPASLENWPTSAVSLQETGSSLLYPLFNLWTADIQKQWPTVSITTASTGSGTGISSAAAGTVNIGASDAYLSPGQMTQYPGLLDVPLAISGQEIAYNVPGVTGNLKLDGPTIASIYEGKVTNWDASQIKALNPGVTLPNLPIVTVHRSDSSGDTFLFSSFLTASDPSGWTIPPGTTVSWPNVAGAVAAQGNGGMVQACQKNSGCIAYIGVSYLKQVTTAGLGYAALKNKAGHYELPTQSAMAAAAGQFASSTPASGAVSMIFGSAAGGYPIVNYEYAIVPTKQPSALAAQAVKAVLGWAIDPTGGNASTYLDQVNFVALPSAVVSLSAKLLSGVTS
ncbi:MAG TPA: phosphate ABC transporter substrate-binding protein PstS [Acidimicrobiales bacterium]|nr:phosphate ABC transporter substrate-binding protein PstS [Acidimicrobiales bacterium]